uniref:Uncharacterized protein n=1 Tax=Oryza sativa subsp. japonica TaxID=39947 RepID=Q6Z409_ORYSJ|nr:hypothetical protein [Oryza sativa Japonica Group]
MAIWSDDMPAAEAAIWSDGLSLEVATTLAVTAFMQKQWAPPVGPVSYLAPAPPCPQLPPHPHLRLLRATSVTPAHAPHLPRPLPSLSRPRPRPRWPGFDFRIPPLSLLSHSPTLAGGISPLPATSKTPLSYLSSAVAPSLFFPISPNTLVLPIAPAPCTHPPPPFPPLRPPLAAARLAAAPRRRRRRVRKDELHPVRPSSVGIRRRNSHPLGTPKPVCRLPSSSRGLPSPFAVVFLRAGHPR